MEAVLIDVSVRDFYTVMEAVDQVHLIIYCMVYPEHHLLILQVKSSFKKVNEFVVLVEFEECMY